MGARRVQVVFSPHVAVRAHPTVNGEIIKVLTKGCIVIAVEQRGEWIKIREVPNMHGR